MSRAVVYETIINEPTLVDMGFDSRNVLVNYDGDATPKPMADDGKMFLVLRWGNHDIQPGILRGPRHFDVWVHMLREKSTDFGHVDRVIDILADALQDIINVPGADGQTVTVIELEGKSSDFRDEAYQTLCRQVSFKMISRVTA